MTEKLSPSFTLGEFTRSRQAEKHGIVNNPSRNNIEAMRNLCVTVLQPLRDFYGKPIIISSGYRCKTLNRIVGGSPSSQHLKGEAADIVFPNLNTAVDWMHFISHNCTYDQMLLEQNRRTGAQWLHVSCRTDKSKNRHQIKIIQIG